LAEAAFPGVERHRADAEAAAELGDSQTSLLLALDLAAPPFAPRLAACRRSESDHDGPPGEETWGSGIDDTRRAKDGSAERLQRPGLFRETGSPGRSPRARGSGIAPAL